MLILAFPIWVNVPRLVILGFAVIAEREAGVIPRPHEMRIVGVSG